MFTEQRAQWLYEHYRWLEQNLPARLGEQAPQLILPTPDFFPVRNTKDHAFAEAVFQTTRRYMGLSEWPCHLTPQSAEDRDARAVLRHAGVYGESERKGAAGTFYSGDDVEITYSPELLQEPVALVATLAHELCHYLLATVKEEPPGGWAEHEPLTDLAAVHEGFGIFLGNTAFRFGQWSDSQYHGWQARTQGYLSEAELGFALGVFCIRNQIDPEIPMRFLKPNPAEVFWDSLGYIEELEQQREDRP